MKPKPQRPAKPQRPVTPPAEAAARWLATLRTTTRRCLAVRHFLPDVLTWRRFGPLDNQMVGLAIVPPEGEPRLMLMPVAELDRLAAQVPEADVTVEMRRIIEARARPVASDQPEDDIC